MWHYFISCKIYANRCRIQIRPRLVRLIWTPTLSEIKRVCMLLLKRNSPRQKHQQTLRRELKAVRKCVSICKAIFLQWKTDTLIFWWLLSFTLTVENRHSESSKIEGLAFVWMSFQRNSVSRCHSDPVVTSYRREDQIHTFWARTNRLVLAVRAFCNIVELQILCDLRSPGTNPIYIYRRFSCRYRVDLS